MIIVIEGPDGSGKTTLANKIAQQTKYPIIHMTQPKSEEERDNMFADYANIIRTHKNLILDRCWYSEMVYGPIKRDRSAISYPNMFSLEEMLAKQGAMIIYATGPKSVLWQRCCKRGEDYITSRETFNSICDEFDKLMSVPHIVPVVRYEYKDLC